MLWISTSERVPDNRREVLVWGVAGFSLAGQTVLRDQFLGTSRFNTSKRGRGLFDIEGYTPFILRRVTHWAEIEGPTVNPPPRSF